MWSYHCWNGPESQLQRPLCREGFGWPQLHLFCGRKGGLRVRQLPSHERQLVPRRLLRRGRLRCQRLRAPLRLRHKFSGCASSNGCEVLLLGAARDVHEPAALASHRNTASKSSSAPAQARRAGGPARRRRRRRGPPAALSAPARATPLAPWRATLAPAAAAAPA